MSKAFADGLDNLATRSSVKNSNKAKLIVVLSISSFLVSLLLLSSSGVSHHKHHLHHRPFHAEEILSKCRAHRTVPGPPKNFQSRTQSDQYEPGTPAVVIRNATIWTGRGQGVYSEGDIILNKGIITKVGHVVPADLPASYDEIHANGAWVTPGIFDMHSHLGVGSAPALDGADDVNSWKGVAQPWLRSLDGLNTHDDSYRLSIAGGVTTALILPGSANAIGGQAFVMKLRSTSERSPTSMLLEPPFTLNSSAASPLLPNRWRHMKHACGENPSRVYRFTRMDTQWSFRKSYNEARKLKDKQDEYCLKAEHGLWGEISGDYPDDLRWEALVDVLRGKVKVNNHCYEAVDFDQMIRLTNEFKFSIVAFHHAHEAYLVPNLLKKMYGTPPALALFATLARYKREAYRGSEYAPRILSDAGLKVVMKSDHNVLDSRFLLYEAQQAFYYGLDHDLALASVTTTPAELQGFGHRLGYVRAGYDADIVLWDSHPLALGATPKQVFIDGIAQLKTPHTVKKSEEFQALPRVPNFDKEAKEAVKHEGLQPLAPSKQLDSVVFLNVTKLYQREASTSTASSPSTSRVVSQTVSRNNEGGVVVVLKGQIVCQGHFSECASFMVPDTETGLTAIDLQGGVLSPGLLTYGGPIGLSEIEAEPSTGDGVIYSPLGQSVPSLIGKEPLIQAIDGLQFQGRDTLLAYRSGVTTAVSSPLHSGFIGGLSTAFNTGARNRRAQGAILKNVAALHITLDHDSEQPSVSTQIAALRHLLKGKGEGATGEYFKRAARGELPLVIDTENADVIATLLDLKEEIEWASNTQIRMVISGGAEAHLLAKELGEAGVGIILTRPRPFPETWSGRNILPGLPLSEQGAVPLLLSHNVTVGLGIRESWQARNAWFDAAWVAIEAGGKLDEATALGLVSTNLEKLLGLEMQTQGQADIVAWQGGDIFSMNSKVVAVVSSARQQIDIF